MVEYLKNLTLGELFNYIVGAIAVVSFLVEKSKKLPFKPWSALISWFGKCLTTNLAKDLQDLKKETKANNEAIIELSKKVDKKFNEQQRQADEKEAKRLRASIISFSDSCRIHDKHTKTHFENVMRDYDDYMAYCDKHNLENHFIEGEKQYIESVYQECLRENKFL